MAAHRRKRTSRQWVWWIGACALAILVVLFFWRPSEKSIAGKAYAGTCSSWNTGEDLDSDALLCAFGEVQHEWGEPAATSEQGDALFDEAGADYKEFWLDKEAATLLLRADVYGPLNDQLGYEFYLTADSTVYQLRVVPGWRVYFWRHTVGVEPAECPGLIVETRDSHIEVSMPLSCIGNPSTVNVKTNIFDIERFHDTQNAEGCHDSTQLDETMIVLG